MREPPYLWWPIQVLYSTVCSYDQDVSEQPPAENRDRGVYGISVTAELVGTGVQNLRLYERRGLVEPDRSAGGTRRYSANDVDRLHQITQLLEQGLNLAGIAMVLELRDDNTRLRNQLDDPSQQ
jgi:MerR family transcriptional regulator/heat shock protein HspR